MNINGRARRQIARALKSEGLWAARTRRVHKQNERWMKSFKNTMVRDCDGCWNYQWGAPALIHKGRKPR